MTTARKPTEMPGREGPPVTHSLVIVPDSHFSSTEIVVPRQQGW